MKKLKKITSTPATKKTIDTQIMAAIDIGSTSIRMAIAQINSEGTIQNLESLQQSVTLGSDTFTKGTIKKSTIEECVRALKSFKRVLSEYQISDSKQIKIVATTAVREATNRDAFLDRIHIATGLSIEVIDEVDVARLTYLSTRAYIHSHTFNWNPNLLVAEMSGGSTELLLLRNENVKLSKGYRLGSLRLREMLGRFKAPLQRQKELMINDIERTISQIGQDVVSEDQLTLIAVGGDARLAASQIIPDWDSTNPVNISLAKLIKFTESIINQSVDEIVQQFHLSYSDAETLGPALLFYIKLAQQFSINSIVICDISMRHGLLTEMSMHGSWSVEFVQQIVNSALEIGRKFKFDENHSRHVAHLAIVLFRALKNEHQLSPRNELLLLIAALLHDIGSFVSIRSHHKHSLYLIQNCELFGLNRKDILIVALIARYHRRSSPKPTHEEYMSIDREDRLLVVKLASILRVADALDRSNSQRIEDIYCAVEDDSLVITIPKVEDLSLEQVGLQSKGSLFEEVYGINVLFRKQSQSLEI
jgi:exopolyphosphatase/guanosine-5'-triphosphate,3'-diphosphate pyrophosphatase